MGDFNKIITQDEKRGRKTKTWWEANEDFKWRVYMNWDGRNKNIDGAIDKRMDLLLKRSDSIEL